MFALLYSATDVLTPSRSSTVSEAIQTIEESRTGATWATHMRCRRRRWRRDSRFRRGHVPTPMVARSVCASRGGTLDSYELVTSGVALHWALACETRRRTCSGRRCSSGRLVRRHEPSGRVRPRGPGKRGHRGHTMRADARGFGLRSPIIVAIATSLERGVRKDIERHTGYALPARPADDQQYLDSSTHHRRAP